MTSTFNDQVQDLRGVIGGPVLVHDEPGYDEARSIWNGDIDRRPAVISRCRDADDVAAALAFAFATGSRSRSVGAGTVTPGRRCATAA